MSKHVPDNLKNKWVNYEFLGNPFKLKDGKTYIRAHSTVFDKTHFYCFEDDWFWHDNPRNYEPKEVGVE